MTTLIHDCYWILRKYILNVNLIHVLQREQKQTFRSKHLEAATNKKCMNVVSI